MIAFLFLAGCLVVAAVAVVLFILLIVGTVGSLSSVDWGASVFGGTLIILGSTAFIMWGPGIFTWAEHTYRYLLGS